VPTVRLRRAWQTEIFVSDGKLEEMLSPDRIHGRTNELTALTINGEQEMLETHLAYDNPSQSHNHTSAYHLTLYNEVPGLVEEGQKLGEFQYRVLF
jgi:hypothetical protein